MGTLFEIRVRSHDPGAAVSAVEAAFRKIREADELLSDYREDSETSELNKAKPGERIEISAEMEEVLALCEQLVRASGGAFDPTVRPLVRLWQRAAHSGTAPSEAEQKRATDAVGWNKLGFSSGRIEKTTGGVELDFGAFGKGWALDAAARELRTLGISDAYLSAGESVILALGDEDPGASGWTVWLRDPSSPEGPPTARVRLADRALSTSAGYERDIVVDGRKYSHIVDPRSGKPVEGIAAASVAAVNAAAADALSTAVFVAGPLEAPDLLKRFGADALLTSGSGETVAVGSAGVFEPMSREAGDR